MFCPNCGKQIPDSRFCPFCGTPVAEKSAPPVTDPAQSAATNTQPTGDPVRNTTSSFSPMGGSGFKPNFSFKSKFSKDKIVSAFRRQLTVSNSKLLAKSGLIMAAAAFAFCVFSNLIPILFKYIPLDFSRGFIRIVLTIAAFLISFAVLFGLSKIPAIKKLFSYSEKPDYFLYALWAALLFINAFIIIGNTLLNEILLWHFIPGLIADWIIDVCLTLLLLVSFALLCRRRSGTTVLLSVVSVVMHFVTHYWNILSVANVRLSRLAYKAAVLDGSYDYKSDLKGFIFKAIIFYLPVVLALCSIVIKFLFNNKRINTIIAAFCALTIIFKLIECIVDKSLTEIKDIISIAGIFMMIMSLSSVPVEASQSKQHGLKGYTKPVVIGLVSGASALLVAAVASGVVSAVYISSHIDDWEYKLKTSYVNISESEWDELESEIRFVSKSALTDLFISSSKMDTYDAIKSNFSAFKTISVCYDRIVSGKALDEELQKDCENLSSKVDNSWANDEICYKYYNKYQEIKPSSERISVSHSYNDGELRLYVENDNYLPINNCVVKVDLTFMYITLNSYSSNDTYRGSETVEVGSVAARDTKTITVSIDPDDYYDSYGSYFTAVLMGSSVSLVSFD